MATSTLIAPGQTAATSAEVTVTDSPVTIGLYVASGKLPIFAAADIVLRTPGADVHVHKITGGSPSVVVNAPCTFVVTRHDVSEWGVNIGVWRSA